MARQTRANWHSRFPCPQTYYEARVARLTHPNQQGWATAACPFHHDRDASLRLQLRHPHGRWQCRACGSGDMIDFHMRHTGKSHEDTVRELVWGCT